MKRRLRYGIVKMFPNALGQHAIRFGIRFGYWACLLAPFVEADFAFWRISIWYGLPSYKITSLPPIESPPPARSCRWSFDRFSQN